MSTIARFEDLLDFPTMPAREVTFDSIERRHIEMAAHEPDCPRSWDGYESTPCECEYAPVVLTHVNGMPVFA
jgi:hypothetical protein